MKITTSMVKELRAITGAGILESKKALEATDGDFDKAAGILREKGVTRAAKRADREASEGVIELYAHPGNRVGVMLELNCETDFVARNEQFLELAHNLALHVAALSPLYVGIDDIPAEEMERVSSDLKVQALAEGKSEEIADKIVTGRLKKFYADVCLLEQPYVKDDEFLVKDLVTNVTSVTGENVKIRRFVRYELGEEI